MNESITARATSLEDGRSTVRNLYNVDSRSADNSSMNHTSRSPDRRATKRISLTASDLFKPPPTLARDRSGRSPPKSSLKYRSTSDKLGRPRDSRDRSSSPGRNSGDKIASGTWNDRERNSHTHATHFKSSAYESYQPIYNSAPRPFPARPGVDTNDFDRRSSVHRSDYASSSRSPPEDPRNFSVSTASQSHGNSKMDLAASPAVSISQCTKQDRASNSNTASSTSRPHSTSKVSTSMCLPQVHPSTADSIADPKSTMHTHANPGQPTRMDVPQLNAAAIEELGQILHQLFEEATDIASLKNQQRAAKRDFDRRDKEFNQWKTQHEKFPTMEEAQRRNKDSAKKTLSAIEEKCAEKDAKVKAKGRQAAERLLRSRSGGDDKEKQKLQSEVESLENTTQNLVKQLREHQSFIEKQGMERLAEREAQDTQIRKLQNELTALRNGFDESTREIDIRVSEAHRNASKSIKDLERVESNVASLLSNLPEDFEVSFRTYSATVDKIYKDYQPKQNNVEEEPTFKATSKTLVDYGLRLEKVENQMKSGLVPLTTHLKTIAQEHMTLFKNFHAVQTTMDSLLHRITALEGCDSMSTLAELRKDLDAWKESANSRLSIIPSNATLTDFQKRLTYAESGTAKVQSEWVNAKKLLEIVEKQSEPLISGERLDTNTFEKQPSNRRPSAPAVSFDAGLEKRLADVENQARQFAAKALENNHAPKTAPEIDYESLKKDIVAVVESMQSGSDTTMGEVIDELHSTIDKVKKDVDNFQNTYVPLSAFTPAITRLDNSVDLLTKNVRSDTDRLHQVDEKYNKWVDDQKTLLANMEDTLYDRVEVVTHGIINIEKRLGLINTKDMAIHILNQMDFTYPNLRAAESTLDQHKSAFRSVESRFKAIDDAIQQLAAKIQTLDGPISQALREEVGGLQTQVTDVKQLAKEAKDSVDVLNTQKLKDSEAVADYFAEIYDRLSDLKEWKERKDQQVQVSPAKRKLATSPSFDRATTIPNGGSARGRSKLDSPASRQSSDEPLSKKTRQHQNGFAPTTAKTNGIHGYPGRKRRRVFENGEDDSEDVDFEPNQPTISDDDED